MNMVFWLRFLRGTVFFSANGGFSERFLNLCNVRGIRLIAPQRNGKSLIAGVLAPDYPRLRCIARASGMVLRAEKKRGLPFLLRQHRARWGLAAAAVFFALLAWMLSGFLWSVEVECGEALSKEQVLAVMEPLGLRPGAWRKALDPAQLSLDGMHALNGKVSWLGIHFSGSRAVVEVHDYIPPDEDETFKDPCNLVADFDGLLLSVQAENGKPAAFPGSGVKTGDLLISGVTEDRYGEAHFYEARGKATALHERKLQVSLPEQPIADCYRAVKTVRYLRLFSLWIPLGCFPHGGRFDAFQTDSFCMLGGITLPLGITTRTRAYYGAEIKLNGFPLLCDDLTAQAYAAFENTLVLSASFAYSQTNGNPTLVQTCECIDFIGKQQKIAMQTG